MIKLVILQWFQYESRYLLETFSICLSYVCAKLTTKFLLLLNQPASNSPFWPKFWTALATAFVGIFFRKNFWRGSGPIPVGHWKEFWISWKKRRFQIFQKPVCPYWSSSWLIHSLSDQGSALRGAISSISFWWSIIWIHCFKELGLIVVRITGF